MIEWRTNGDNYYSGPTSRGQIYVIYAPIEIARVEGWYLCGPVTDMTTDTLEEAKHAAELMELLV